VIIRKQVMKRQTPLELLWKPIAIRKARGELLSNKITRFAHSSYGTDYERSE